MPSNTEKEPSTAHHTDALTPGGLGRIMGRRFRLTITAGPGEGHHAVSESDVVVVGTHASANFILQDAAVSRFHCELRLSADTVVLRDLQSLNGTHVDGVPVIEAPLRNGAIIALGRTQLRFDLDVEPAAVPVSTRKRFGLAIGRSPAMAKLFALLERVAATDATVLIEGETGTGKELVAESLHNEGARRAAPFMVVDCGAIPRDLLESEIFGHERGSFTGALTAREGAFEAASGGTLFLDEIGELSPELQPKILRALERREIKRVGSNHYTKVDVRLIAATNRNLREEVNSQKFRPDLYYRVAVVEVRLPPLRDRREDFPLLIEHILASLEASTRPEADLLRRPQVIAELLRHSWPGNVRELRNYIERSLALSDTAPPLSTESEDQQPEVNAHLPLKNAREKWVGSFERRYLEELLRRNGDNVTAAARAAGVARNHFYRLLWRYSLR